MMLSETLHLTPRLVRVLDALEGAYGHILSHEQVGEVLHPARVLRCPWTDSGEDGDVKVAIHCLRRKLHGSTHDIETIWGRGYRLVEKAE
jgi:DNA-binding winged helix-turn-helix (wHTH) protein